MHVAKSAKGYAVKCDSPSHSRPPPTHQQEQFPVYSSRNMPSYRQAHANTPTDAFCCGNWNMFPSLLYTSISDFAIYLRSFQIGMPMGQLHSI